MMAKYDGGSAFPNGDQRGMSLRDYFAGQAAGTLMLSCMENIELSPDRVAAAAARAAYMLADAMLVERDKS